MITSNCTKVWVYLKLEWNLFATTIASEKLNQLVVIIILRLLNPGTQIATPEGCLASLSWIAHTCLLIFNHSSPSDFDPAFDKAKFTTHYFNSSESISEITQKEKSWLTDLSWIFAIFLFIWLFGDSLVCVIVLTLNKIDIFWMKMTLVSFCPHTRSISILWTIVSILLTATGTTSFARLPSCL